LFDAYPGQIAAVMLEPATTIVPAPSSGAAGEARTGRHFLHDVQALCRSNGALFILDEMITGFRWHVAGAQTYFGVEPDLSTFGKGMANGFAVAAVGGRREVMEVGAIDRPGMERTFLLSTTHGAEMPGLGAFIETVRIYRAEGVVEHLWEYGRRLQDGFAAVTTRHGLGEAVRLDGPAICLNYVTLDSDGQISPAFRTLLMQELLKRGVMMPWIAVSKAHGPTELQQTLEALDGALSVYAQALDGGVDKFLVGAAVRPVFRSHN
jgi:glutamate-1-semialdehyde 2,1-aminomutase